MLELLSLPVLAALVAALVARRLFKSDVLSFLLGTLAAGLTLMGHRRALLSKGTITLELVLPRARLAAEIKRLEAEGWRCVEEGRTRRAADL